MLLVLRILNALVWFGFGFYAKLLDGVPRHRLIVARVVGQEWAGLLVMAVGFGEVALAAWIVSGRFPKSSAAAQTLALLAMNTLELVMARELLLSPWGMIAANVVMLSTAWYVAIASDGFAPPKTHGASASPSTGEV